MNLIRSNIWSIILSLSIILTVGLNQFIQAQENQLLNPTQPNNCEGALALLETAAVDTQKDGGSSIIVIARLGEREKSQGLNQRRLKAAAAYLKSKVGNKVISAVGEKTKGYGRLELYVSGRLLYVIAYPRNGIIDCRDL